MFEHRHEPLISRAAFLRRFALHFGVTSLVILGSLGIGVVGYHWFAGLSWIDSLVNASMLLGGMGPVGAVENTAGKLFASGYALFCGLVFIIASGVLLAPVFHRFMHRFHLDFDDEQEDSKTTDG